VNLECSRLSYQAEGSHLAYKRYANLHRAKKLAVSLENRIRQPSKLRLSGQNARSDWHGQASVRPNFRPRMVKISELNGSVHRLTEPIIPTNA
jgi:hypothetical protein